MRPNASGRRCAASRAASFRQGARAWIRTVRYRGTPDGFVAGKRTPASRRTLSRAEKGKGQMAASPVASPALMPTVAGSLQRAGRRQRKPALQATGPEMLEEFAPSGTHLMLPGNVVGSLPPLTLGCEVGHDCCSRRLLLIDTKQRPPFTAEPNHGKGWGERCTKAACTWTPHWQKEGSRAARSTTRYLLQRMRCGPWSPSCWRSPVEPGPFVHPVTADYGVIMFEATKQQATLPPGVIHRE